MSSFPSVLVGLKKSIMHMYKPYLYTLAFLLEQSSKLLEMVFFDLRNVSLIFQMQTPVGRI